MRHDWKLRGPGKVRTTVLTVLLTGAFVACSLSLFAQQRGNAQAPSAAMIARGKYLVTIQDCNGCHTPFNEKGEPDMSKMLSGHPANVKVAAPRPRSGDWLVSINSTNTAWSGPWGVSFTSNLTPDRTTGIGSWTEETFIAAIRQGKKSGVGRTLLNPMPWRMYAMSSDDDLKAIFAYLKTVPAISNRVPNPLPPAQ
jgi:mono/diheme cytochrome c family protein